MNNAQLYAQSNALQKRDANTVLGQFVPRMEWSENDAILDVGSGSGDVTRNVVLPQCPQLGSLVGVDRSTEMVTFAREHFTHERLSFRSMDIAEVTQPRQFFPEGFTKIFSFYCLHWIKDHTRVLNNIYQLLRPGGTCLLAFLAHNPIFSMYKRLSLDNQWAPYMTDVEKYIPVHQYSPAPDAEFQAALEGCGFKVIECSAPEFHFVFENMNYLKNALKAVNPFIERIPQDLKDDYLNACIQEFRKMKTPLLNGKMVARYNLLVAYAQK